MSNRKIWIVTVNTDGVEIEHEWDSVEDLQRDWRSEDCLCPCGR